MLIYAIVAGFTYCGVCTLHLLGKLPSFDNGKSRAGTASALCGDFVQDVIHWLVYRQTITIAEEEQPPDIPVHTVVSEHEGSGAHQETPDSEHHASLNGRPSASHQPESTPGAFVVQGASLDVLPFSPTIKTDHSDLEWIGFSGRTNKVADTCYSFWVGGTLSVRTHLFLSRR